jgi:hypothetical protein
MMFLGCRVIGQMAMALLPIQIAVAVWLMVKGFEERHLRIHIEAHEAELAGA